MKEIISEILKDITPPETTEQLQEKTAEEVCELVRREVVKYPQVVDLVLGGSFAKKTWLEDDSDIDIFIRFKKDTSKKEFEDISIKIGLDVLVDDFSDIRYAQHPYVEGRIKNTRINIVPCYDVKNGEWKSAADRSPFHTSYMKKTLTQEMRNEVRILKTFLKANRISGAEIAKQGFSGYVSEVLILEYGSFENVIISISEIKEKQVIGNPSKIFETSLVIIDPIDSNRNLAAAISDENIGKFVFLARAFKEKPSKKFFKSKKFEVSDKHWGNLLVVKFDFEKNRPDIVWGQIKKAVSSLSTQLEIGGFTVLRNKSHIEQDKEIYLFFFLESVIISRIYSKSGPEFFRADDSKKFISKNLKSMEPMWIGKNKKITVLKKRRHVDASEFMTECLKERGNMPKGLQSDLERGFEVSVGERNLTKSIKEAASELILTDDVFLYFN